MACYNPLVAWEHPDVKTDSGKSKILFKLPNGQNERNGWKQIQLPCGQCIGCRLAYSKEWAIRCELEKRESPHNYFVTLTYSPEYLNDPETPTEFHKKYQVDRNTGEVISEYYNLVPGDLSRFLKQLREHWRRNYNHSGIRFFGCGEYGDKNRRPHFHVLLFNFPMNDLKPFFLNSEKQQVYRSETLEKLWGKGIVSVGEVTFQSAAYVARYIVKKQKGEAAKNDPKEPEFVRMSRMPGIGKAYFDKNKDKIYKNDEIILLTKLDKVIASKPPGYFDKLYDELEPARLHDIKENRRHRAQESRENKSSMTTLNISQQLAVEEREQARRALALKRTLREDI